MSGTSKYSSTLLFCLLVCPPVAGCPPGPPSSLFVWCGAPRRALPTTVQQCGWYLASYSTMAARIIPTVCGGGGRGRPWCGGGVGGGRARCVAGECLLPCFLRARARGRQPGSARQPAAAAAAATGRRLAGSCWLVYTTVHWLYHTTPPTTSTTLYFEVVVPLILHTTYYRGGRIRDSGSTAGTLVVVVLVLY